MVWTGDTEPSAAVEQLTDPSFEAQDPLWQLGNPTNCHYHTDGSRTGDTLVDLLWSLIAFPQDGRFGQQMTLPAGNELLPVRVSWWMRRRRYEGPAPEKAWMRISLWDGNFDPSGGGNFGAPPAGQWAEVQLSTLTTAWSYHSFLSVAPGQAAVTLGIQGTHKDNPSIGDFTTATDFDDFSVKRVDYDPDDDPPTPTYDEDVCVPSAFSGDPTNTSIYTPDPK
jgi:hypothetical protein